MKRFITKSGKLIKMKREANVIKQRLIKSTMFTLKEEVKLACLVAFICRIDKMLLMVSSDYVNKP